MLRLVVRIQARKHFEVRKKAIQLDEVSEHTVFHTIHTNKLGSLVLNYLSNFCQPNSQLIPWHFFCIPLAI